MSFAQIYYTCSNPNCLHTKVIAFTCKSRLCNSCGKKQLSNGSLSKMKSYPNAIINISLTPCPQLPAALWSFFKANRFLLNTLSTIAAKILLKIAKKKKSLSGFLLRYIPLVGI
ncbi:transposase zinc-binding domain-containing protein [Piscirickettsia salmonis]|uniref:transposase zinc-binding domain-containing protein n=1 Tax=Piscirickettsia salmonis TaxID=1238 RepID=UPI0018AC909F|nr:transposase zinc-binding domain-containing protein [Piscirickettsia salmonis]